MDLKPEVQDLLERQGRVARTIRIAKHTAELATALKDEENVVGITKALVATQNEIRELKDDLRIASKRCNDMEEELRTALMVVRHNPSLT